MFFHELLTFFTGARGLIAADCSLSLGGLHLLSRSRPLGAVSLPLVRLAECAASGCMFCFHFVWQELEFGTTYPQL